MPTGTTAQDGDGLDRRLRRLADADDDEAWVAFLAAEGGFLRTVARDHLAGEGLLEDVVQEAVIRLRRGLPGYRSYGDAEARGWLRGVVRHTALDLTAAERARRQREQRTARAAPTSHDPQPDAPADPAIAERMESSLRGLPEVQHRVIDLHYFEGLSFTDIASRLRLTRHHVHVLHGRALDQLRQRLVPAGAPALSVAALVLLLQASAAAGVSSPVAGATASVAPASGAAKSSLMPVMGWTAAGLIAAGVIAVAAWYAADRRTPAAPVAVPAVPEAAPTITQTFVRRFQKAHPGWRPVDAGRRLGDRSVWSAIGPWTAAEAGALARIDFSNPGDQPLMGRLVLGPALDPARTARLLVATLTIAERPQRTGFRLAIIPDPQQPSSWDGFQWDVALTPHLLGRTADAGPAQVQQHRIGLAVDDRQVHFLLDDQMRSEERTPRVATCFAIAIYNRLSPERQTATLGDVQVYEAEVPSRP